MTPTPTSLAEFLDFYNGKAIKALTEGQHAIFGSNGIIGFSEKHNYSNAIIIGRVGAYCGSIHHSPKKFWASDNTIIAKPKQNHNIKYLYYRLKSLPLGTYAGGAAQPLLTQRILNSITAPIFQDEI